jgi:dTMP kinase
MSGSFITFEGIDLCGKSTQAEKLIVHLRERGIDVVFSREPGGPPISEKIREILLNPKNRAMTSMTELLLYEASRAQHTEELIRPALQAEKWVICDRYGDASFAYQGCGRNLGGELVRRLNHLATGGLVPDLTIVIDRFSPAGTGGLSAAGPGGTEAGEDHRRPGHRGTGPGADPGRCGSIYSEKTGRSGEWQNLSSLRDGHHG